MCLIISGEEFWARNDTSSELNSHWKCIFLLRWSLALSQTWNFPVGSNSYKILSPQVSSETYRTKNNLLLSIRGYICLCVCVCVCVCVYNWEIQFTLTELQHLFTVHINHYSIYYEFDTFHGLYSSAILHNVFYFLICTCVSNILTGQFNVIFFTKQAVLIDEFCQRLMISVRLQISVLY
jgi:hypothetical protein